MWVPTLCHSCCGAAVVTYFTTALAFLGRGRASLGISAWCIQFSPFRGLLLLLLLLLLQLLRRCLFVYAYTRKRRVTGRICNRLVKFDAFHKSLALLIMFFAQRLPWLDTRPR